ncbi:MAG: C40 family peptidase [Bacteroidales bacterium]|nr:C40 family peptidase [Bacteroidales bacterium]
MTNYGIALLAAVAMRKEPAERSEMGSQLLFGEIYRVLAEEENWIRISSCYDQYEGWISRRQHSMLTDTGYEKMMQLSRRILPVKFAEVVPEYAPAFTIVAGSELHGFNKAHRNITIEDKPYKISGDPGEIRDQDAKGLLKTAMQFLNTPYLWGGRSMFGCDCSGFVQTVFKIHGIYLPRDASQQSGFGNSINSLEDSCPGDLAFFMNEEQIVHHVGIILSPSEIIHCSGFVRIDPLTAKGIFSVREKQYTHQYFFIRRILPSIQLQ